MPYGNARAVLRNKRRIEATYGGPVDGVGLTNGGQFDPLEFLINVKCIKAVTSSCAHVSRIIRDKRLNNPTRSADERVIEVGTVFSYSLKFPYLVEMDACNNSRINTDAKRCIKIE